VLSALRTNGTPAHFRILPTADGGVKLADATASDATFGDVHELVAHFSVHALSPTIPRLAGCIPPPGSHAAMPPSTDVEYAPAPPPTAARTTAAEYAVPLRHGDAPTGGVATDA
jgi:hypothetical protein